MKMFLIKAHVVIKSVINCCVNSIILLHVELAYQYCNSFPCIQEHSYN